MIFLLAAAFAAVTPPGLASLITRILDSATGPQPGRFAAWWIFLASGHVVIHLALRYPPGMTGAVISLAAAIAWWWWNRRGRRQRTVAWAGNKARAIWARLQRAMDGAGQPRVLRPATGGAW